MLGSKIAIKLIFLKQNKTVYKYQNINGLNIF